MVSLLLFFEDTLLPLVKEKKKRQSLETKSKRKSIKSEKKQAIFLDIGEKKKKGV
jgi:hypothetical protein